MEGPRGARSPEGRAPRREHICEIALSVYLTEVTHATRRPGEPEAATWANTHADLLMWEGAGSAGRRAPLRGDDESGDGRIRTADPLLAKQVLCQLSYIPAGCDRSQGVVGARSLRAAGLPTATRAAARLRRAARATWAIVDSNHRPHGYQPCALTT
jgi:hypothetical protein